VRLVRIRHSTPNFVKGQRLEVLREDGGKVWLKGMDIQNADWRRVVVSGPHSEEDVEEYVPDPPAPTVEEKLKGLMQ
jgi:hypothetical protein